MISITQIALFVASAALMVSAGPTNAPVLEAVRSTPEPEAVAPGLNHTVRELDFDPRSITDASDPRLQKRNGELYCGTFASMSTSLPTAHTSKLLSLYYTVARATKKKKTRHSNDENSISAAEFYNAHDLVQDILNSPKTMHTIPARGCLRTGCKNTSGIYVCNVWLLFSSLYLERTTPFLT